MATIKKINKDGSLLIRYRPEPSAPERTGTLPDQASLIAFRRVEQESRKLGIPCRYVSGYINQPGEIESHAWVQVWAGAAQGWVDYDPTHSCLVADDHVVVAVGRDYADVPPNRGAWRGNAKESIQVGVRVQSVARLPADWIDADSLPMAITGRETTGGGDGGRRQGRPSVRQFQRMLYRQQQHQQQQQS